MADPDEKIDAAARKLAEEKARLEDLGKRADDLEKEVEQPAQPLNQGWKGDVA
jgi:hypothetical protein